MSGMERVEANRDGMAGRRLGAWMLGMAVLVLGSQALAPALRADDAGAGPAARAVRLSSVDGQVQLSKIARPLPMRRSRTLLCLRARMLRLGRWARGDSI